MSKPKIPDVVTAPSQTSASELLPVQKAFTMERVTGGWSFVTVTFQGANILKIEKSEPDLKIVVIQQFKIASFKYWDSIG